MFKMASKSLFYVKDARNNNSKISYVDELTTILTLEYKCLSVILTTLGLSKQPPPVPCLSRRLTQQILASRLGRIFFPLDFIAVQRTKKMRCIKDGKHLDLSTGYPLVYLNLISV